MTQAVSLRVGSIRLMNQVTFQKIDSESAHNSSGSPGINADGHIARAASLGIRDAKISPKAQALAHTGTARNLPNPASSPASVCQAPHKARQPMNNAL